MRTCVRLIAAACLFTACSKGGTQAPGASTVAPTAPTGHAAPPATILYLTGSFGSRGVSAVPEDNSAAAVALATTGVDTTFAQALSGRRVLLAEHAADESVTNLYTIGVDGSARQVVGSFAAGAYNSVGRVIAAGDDLVAEMVQTGGTWKTDVFALHAGTATQLVQGAALVSVSGGRAAYLVGANSSTSAGDLRSKALDGTAELALGGGDGQDKVAQALGDLVLVTLHSTGAAQVRLTRIDGIANVDLAQGTAFGLSTAGRILFAQNGAVMSADLGGADVRKLADGTALLVTDDGQVLLTTNDGRMLASAADGSAQRLIDPAAGTAVRFTRVFGDRVVYASGNDTGFALRTALLSGAGATQLYAQDFTIPVPTALSNGRVVFHISYAGQLEGGQVLSVLTDGTQLQGVGREIDSGDGQLHQSGASDQDFEAVTPNGRLIVEMEYEGQTFGQQLLTAASDSGAARPLTDLGSNRFVALVP